MSPGEIVLVWAAGRHGDLDAPDACGDAGADFEEFERDDAKGGVGELAVPEGDTVQGVDQRIGTSSTDC